MTYGFIGTGNMGGALARAAAKAVEVRSSIVLANRTPEKAARLADEIGASVAGIVEGSNQDQHCEKVDDDRQNHRCGECAHLMLLKVVSCVT